MLFRGCATNKNLKTLNLDRFVTWLQLWDLLYDSQKLSVAKMMENKVCDFIKHEDDSYEDGDVQGKFIWVRVWMNVLKLIIIGVMLQIGNRSKS